MKKKIYMVVLGVALLFTMVGCGKKDNKDDKVRDDVVEFVNEELAAISADRDSAISVYNTYFATAGMDKGQFLNDLQNTAIPNMDIYIANLEKVEVDSDEAEKLKQYLLESATKQRDAMNMVVLSLSEENPEYLTQANDMIADAQSSMAMFESELKKISEDYDITVNGLVATSTDATK